MMSASMISRTSVRRHAIVACAVVAGIFATMGIVSAAKETAAAYADRASVTTTTDEGASLRTQSTGFLPTNTYLANTAMAIQDDGTLWVWGYRGGGISGTGAATVAPATTPSAVVLPNDGYAPGGHRRVVKVAATSLDNYYPTDASFTGVAALSDDGLVYTWGGNNNNKIMGRPGAGADYYRPGVVRIASSDGPVVDLKSSSGVFMALTANGTLYTWGYPQGRGVTGQGTATASSAEPMAIMTGVHSIGAGIWNGWAIKGNYSEAGWSTGVFWWGWSNDGLSYGDPSGDDVRVTASQPTRSTALSKLAIGGCDAVGIVAGSDQDLCSIQSMTGHYYGYQFVNDLGQLWAWGAGNQAGTGRPNATAAINNTPTIVALPGAAKVSKVAFTEDYVVLLGVEGLVFVYGRYSYGGGPDPATGAMSTVNLTTPTRIVALGEDIKAIGGFGYSGMALTSMGNLVMWGGSTAGGSNNTYYSIRNGWGTTTTPTAPRQPLTDFPMPGNAQ